MKIHLIAAVLATAALTACGTGPRASGSFQTRVGPHRLFLAARDAAPEVGFRVTSVSGEDTIVAEQGVILGHGSAIGMTAYITSSPGGTQTLKVTFMAPPGTFTFGNFDDNVADYITAVRATVPDLRAAR